MKLAASKTVDAAISRADAEPPVIVEPWIEEAPDGKRLRIREDAGYDLTNVPLKDG
jgi:hypothetical protein